MVQRLLLVLVMATVMSFSAADDDVVVVAEPPKDEEKSSGEFAPPHVKSMVKFEAEDAVAADKDKEISAELYESALFMLESSASRTVRQHGWDVMQQAADLGNVDARVKIGMAKLLGDQNFDQDLGLAKGIFSKAAEESGNPESQFALGFLHATGTGTNSSNSKALLYYTFAAFGGSSWAQMALGYRYWSGTGVATSCEKALDNYRRVADHVASGVTFGGGKAIQRIRLHDEYESGSGYASGVLDSDLLDYYQLLADKGDVQAQVGLGQLHFQGGRGIQVDHQLALNYFSQASEGGSPVATAFLGKMYLEGSGSVINASNETAFRYFKKAADQGNPVGQSGLGLMYLEGKGVKKDPKKAADLFRKAADQNWVDGQLHLGNMYYHGFGVSQDYKLAVKYFNLASQSGHVLAFHKLAEMHATGTGMLRSCSTAVELYKNVAERGRWGELLMEAHRDYKNGRLEEAIMKYLLLAELGYEVAQSNAAFLFDRKETGSRFDEATVWFRALVYLTRAAAQGYSAARVRLGDYYYYGLGTETDFEAAASHYRIASEQQNNAQAMFNLGYMHEVGRGMPQDAHLAKRFYDMAAETATDAKVPVALALGKLAVTFAFSNLQIGRKITLSPDTWAKIELYWDLYLLTMLFGVLGLVLFVRRPAVVRYAAAAVGNRRNNDPAR